jgi:hypothetical protein
LVPLDFFGGGVAPVEVGVGWAESSPTGAFSMVTRRWAVPGTVLPPTPPPTVART